MLFKLDNQKIQLEQGIRKQLQSTGSLHSHTEERSVKSLKVSNLTNSVKDYERSGKQEELKEEIRKLKRELENEEDTINHSYHKRSYRDRDYKYNRDLYKESLDLSDEI